MEKVFQLLERLVIALERDATAREVNNSLIKAQFDRKNGGSPVVEEAILESKLPPAQAEQQVPGESSAPAGVRTVAKMTEKRKQMVEEYKKRGWVIDPFEATADMEKKVKDAPLKEEPAVVDVPAVEVEEFAVDAPPKVKVDKETLRAKLKDLQKFDYEKARGVKLSEEEYTAEWASEKFPEARSQANVRARNLINTIGGTAKFSDVKEEAYQALYSAVQTALKG